MNGRFLPLRCVWVLTLALGLAGCSSAELGTAPTAHSAVLDLSSPDSEASTVTVERIDRAPSAAESFRALLPGSNACALSPGVHTVALAVTDFWEADRQDLDGKGSLKAHQTVSFTCLPNHRYRFAAYRKGTTFDLTLWDETQGTGTKVEHWPLNGLADLQPFTS